MAEMVKVANTDELEPGQGMVAEVGDKEIALFNVDGTFYAVNNTCVHRGGPLGDSPWWWKVN